MTLASIQDVIQPSFWDIPVTVPDFEIDPDLIDIVQIPVGSMVDYQRAMSRATWRPSPGRGLSFRVNHEERMLGILHLASPVINLGVRDRFLGLDSLTLTQRGFALREYADLSVCVAAQPVGWYWNIGKLIALLAPTLGEYWQTTYGDTLRGIVTTSLWGRGTQYNRIYRFLGYTRGFGHEHVSDAAVAAMRAWLRRNNHAPFPYKSNVRWGIIKAYRRYSGEQVSDSHGNVRGVYYREAGGATKDVTQEWYVQWGAPRHSRVKERTAPYQTGTDLAVAASSDAPTNQAGEGGPQPTLPLQLQNGAQAA